MSGAARGSIHLRLLLAASLVLTAFLGLTGLALDKAFRSAAQEALRARLKSSVYGLLAAAEEGPSGQLSLPQTLPDPRLNLPDSGLYAEVAAPSIGYHWRSASTLGRELDLLQTVYPGEFRYRYQRTAGGSELLVLDFAVNWEGNDGRGSLYILAVGEDLRSQREQIEAFRNSLFGWLGGVALLLLLAQGWVLRWGLKPLRTLAGELGQIEDGARERLSGNYPRELGGLARSLNSLIRHAETRQRRYRDSLGDLAHSLKTPLAILRNLADHQGAGEAVHCQRVLAEQVTRMDQIVGHQLQRAVASGRVTLASSLTLKPVVERLARSLAKVYRERPVRWELAIDDGCRFRGDEGDLMELLGNLMDNAWKYGGGRVRIGAREDPQGLELHVEDDGRGIPEDQAQEVLRRGGRMDQQQPGQGIGLAVVQDLISAYGGELRIGRSELGGADMTLIFPLPGGSEATA